MKTNRESEIAKFVLGLTYITRKSLAEKEEKDLRRKTEKRNELKIKGQKNSARLPPSRDRKILEISRNSIFLKEFECYINHIAKQRMFYRRRMVKL